MTAAQKFKKLRYMIMDENNKTQVAAEGRGGFTGFVGSMFRGAGQVMFQNSVWTGLLFLAGIFWGAYSAGHGTVAWGALAGLFVSTLAGHILALPASEGRQGLWGFNGILVGCAFPTFMGGTVWMWIALALCAALTTWVRTGLNNVMKPWKINSLTFPFVMCTWIFLLAARDMYSLPILHSASSAAPAVEVGILDWVQYWLRGISQVFLIDSWVTGLLFLAGLLAANPWAALWAGIGSAVAMAAASAFKVSTAAVAAGMYGFSPVLTAVALATVFHKPGWGSALWAALGIVVTVFVQAAMNVLLSPAGIATLTAPFCITTWLFLLPLLRFGGEKPDHTDWVHKPHLARRGS